MNTPHVDEHLTAYLSGDLDDALLRSVTQHLQTCDACRNQLDALSAVWQRLDRSTDVVPPESLKRDFRTMMLGYQAGLDRSDSARQRTHFSVWDWLARPALQFGAAGCLLLVGAVVGYIVNDNTGNARDIAELHQEVRGLSNLLTVSLLKQESASDRLTGVSWGNKLVDHDPEVEAALLNTMNHDRNVNVRLAALDALSHSLNSSTVRREIIGAFPEQKSPLMQMALVDILSKINDSDSHAALRQALDTPGLLPEVRARILQGLGREL